MKIYGHPWSINTRKVLMTLAEKQHEAQLALVMIPKGEQRSAAHLELHPFAKVPVLDDDGFVLYETCAINRYLDQRLPGTKLTPIAARDAARADQFVHVADSYFAPHAQPLIVELMFRRYLGGEQNTEAIRSGREGMQLALDVIDTALVSRPYLAGDAFSLADIHWMPYLEYLTRIGEGEAVSRREHVDRWWQGIAARPTWHHVARTGPQPYDPA